MVIETVQLSEVMKDFTPVTDISYIYGENGGNQGKIDKVNLVSSLVEKVAYGTTVDCNSIREPVLSPRLRGKMHPLIDLQY